MATQVDSSDSLQAAAMESQPSTSPTGTTLLHPEIHGKIASLLPGFLLLIGTVVVVLLVLLGIALFTNLAGNERLPAAGLVLVCFGVTMGLLSLMFGVAMTWLGIVSAYSIRAGARGGQQVSASLALASSSPGLFFALLGTALIGISIYRDVGYKSTSERSESSADQASRVNLHPAPAGRPTLPPLESDSGEASVTDAPSPSSMMAATSPTTNIAGDPPVVIIRESNSFGWGSAPAPTNASPYFGDKTMMAPDFRQIINWDAVEDSHDLQLGLYTFTPFTGESSSLIYILYHSKIIGDKVFYFDPVHCQFTAVYDFATRKHTTLNVPNNFRSPADVEKTLMREPIPKSSEQMPPLPVPYENERMLIPVLPNRGIEVAPAPPAPAAPAAPPA